MNDDKRQLDLHVSLQKETDRLRVDCAALERFAKSANETEADLRAKLAAAEKERDALKAEVERYRADLHMFANLQVSHRGCSTDIGRDAYSRWNELQSELDDALSQRDRYRAALEQIATHNQPRDPDGARRSSENVAREALGGKT